MKVICEISGGADSALAAIKAIHKYGRVQKGVFVNYGQKCMEPEMEAAQKIASRLYINLQIVSIYGVWKDGGMISGETENNSVYTPLRNVLIASATMSVAECCGANVVVTGSKGLTKDPTDAYSYYDSTVPFYKIMESVWNYSSECKNSIKIIDPILAEGRNRKMDRKEVYEGLLEEGFGFNDTWSCFSGRRVECGKCRNCLSKIEIFKELQST